MAEIRVQPKRRSLAWLWVLLVLAVVALVAWYLLNQGVVQVRQTGSLGPTPTALALAPAPAPPLAPVPALT